MSVSTKKGTRTRYVNLIKSEVGKTAQLLAEIEQKPEEIHVQRKKAVALKGTIERYLEKFEDAVEQLAEQIEYLDDDDLQAKSKETAAFEALEPENITTISTATEAISQLNAFEEECYKKKPRGIDDDPQKNPNNVRLPKLQIPKFSGDIMNFQEFWDQYESAIHKNDKLANVEKMSYLKSLLIGEAQEVVAGLTLTNANYSVMVKSLNERYGNPQVLIDAHYSKLMNLEKAPDQTKKLRQVIDAMERHFRSLEALKQNIDQNVFISLIFSKIPKDVVLHLELQKPKSTPWTVEVLREKLDSYISAREKAEGVQNDSSPKKSLKNSNGGLNNYANSPKIPPTVETLSTMPPYTPKCIYCKKNHWSDECCEFRTADDRLKKLTDCCYLCLKKGHRKNTCNTNRVCAHCGKKKQHHRSLCPKKFGSSNPQRRVENETPQNETKRKTPFQENALLGHGNSVIMKTAKPIIASPTHQKMSPRTILDTASHRTYLVEWMAMKMKLEIKDEEEDLSVLVFGSTKARRMPSRVTTFYLLCKDGPMEIKANVVPIITGKIIRYPLSEEIVGRCQDLDLDFADDLPTSFENSNIELLIGNDYYDDITGQMKIPLDVGLYLCESRLGWILSGRVESHEREDEYYESTLSIQTYVNDVCPSSIFTQADPNMKSNCDSWWNLESIGVTDDPKQCDDDVALQNFYDTVRFVDGRYEVTWPWKSKDVVLPDNYILSYHRLVSLVRKLSKTPDLMKKYQAIFDQQMQDGIIEKVQPEMDSCDETDLKHYIPHHAVITPTKTTTRLRVVYDGSAKTQKGYSLNECLLRGPVILKDLVGLLLRFRLHPIAVIADVEKAFLQVSLREPDRDVTRFLWLKDVNCPEVNNNIQEYRFCRVPFGIISSPFLLAVVVDYHLRKIDTPNAQLIRDNMYVDNVVTGVNTVTEAKELYTESKSMFGDMAMNLRCFASNNKEFLEEIPEKDRESNSKMKVLGMVWSTEDDTLSCPAEKLDVSVDCQTKHSALTILSSVYDPLGLFTPVIIGGKIFIQKLWIEGKTWDESMTPEQETEWLKIKNELRLIPTMVIPRYIGLNELKNMVLHCFCDSSLQAYATAIYLKTGNDERCDVNLMFSKSRVTPKGGLTIPRLELLGILIGMRAIKFVCEQIQMKIDECHLWSDSTCALQWISSKKKLSVFVENRVREIRSLMRECQIMLHYVPGNENPADLATKPQKIEVCCSRIWLKGPEWLVDEVLPCWQPENSLVDTDKLESYVSDVVPSELCATSTTATETKGISSVLDIKSYETLVKLLRTTAWTMRFIDSVRGHPPSDELLTVDELKKAKMLWDSEVQRQNFADVFRCIEKNLKNPMKTQLGIRIDEDGLLRCYGRLVNAELTEGSRAPKLLPTKCDFTDLTISHYHEKVLHSGAAQTLCALRQEYWVPKGRVAVRKVLYNCGTCRKMEGDPYGLSPMAPLPKSRVTRSLPFTYTGLDYFGPLNVKQGGEVVKVSVCLYTCLAVRALHLELVMDNSTEEFLMSLRRFLAQRGKPLEITSDNASQFKLADEALRLIWSNILNSEEVKSYVSNENIKWNYITELAPWKGGAYERLVGLVKRCLRKTLGKACLTVIQMQTLLKEVEAVVNSRPLVYVGEDINSDIPLSPSDFLCIKSSGIPPSMADSDEDYEPQQLSSAEKIIKWWKKGLKYLEKFWYVWQNDYLQSLRERKQMTIRGTKLLSPFPPREGAVVLVRDENVKRGSWKMAKILKLLMSEDGFHRTAVIRLPSGATTRRALSMLYPLECPVVDDTGERPESVTDSDSDEDSPDVMPGNQASTDVTSRNADSDKDSSDVTPRNQTSSDEPGDNKRPSRKTALRAREMLKQFIEDGKL